MKKIKDFISVLLAALIVFALPISAMAASSDIDNGSNYDFFTVSSIDADIAAQIQSNIQNGKTQFTVSKEVETSEPGLFNSIVIDISLNQGTKANSGTVNWTLSGRYYFKSSDETVSNYGNNGSVDYNGSSLYNKVWNVYHNVTYKYKDKYEAKSSSSETNVSENQKTGIKFNGKFRLKNKSSGDWCEDANIYIIVFKDGTWNTHGNYSNIHVD